MENVYLVTGDDVCAIQEKARELIEQLTGGKSDAFSVEVYKESDEQDSTQVIHEALLSLSTPPFLSGKKTIWVQNLSFHGDEGRLASSKEQTPFTKALTRFTDFIATCFPSDINLVVSGPGVDPKAGFYKACSRVGKVFYFAKPDLSRRSWREDVRKTIQDKAARYRIKLGSEIIEYLIEVIGVDTSRITNEIEKIYCRAGQNPTLEQVQELCIGNRDAIFYALSNALGVRDINFALKTVAQILGSSKESDSLVVGQIRYLGRYISELVQAKLLMAYYKVNTGDALGQAVVRMGPEDKERFKSNVVLSKSNWRIRTLGCHAEKYTGAELVKALLFVARADKTLVSSNLSRRFILEMLVIRIIVGRKWSLIDPAQHSRNQILM